MQITSPPPFRINRSHRRSLFGNIVTTFLTVAASVVIAVLLNFFVFQSYYVDGESMSPTLHDDNRLIISKVERTVAHLSNEPYVPERGQIIVINGQVSPQTSLTAPELIKRVVGIPGDTIIIKDGTVMIKSDSGREFDVDKELKLDLEPTYTAKPLSIYVREGTVFVLGDNRAEGGSLDSRTFGLVNTDYIDGRLWARIMPFTQGRVF